MNLVIGTERIEDAVKEIKATLYAMDNGSRYLRRDDLYKMEEALERILDDVIPEYYVFKCEACGRLYATQTNSLDLILSNYCKCSERMANPIHSAMEFIGIEKRRPSGCVVLGKF